MNTHTDTQAFPRMKHSRSDSNVTLGRRDTMSTLGDFDTELPPMSPSVSDDHSRQGSSSSRQSIFLRMQQKREEQRRSIYAYRASNARQQQQQPMVYPAMLSLVARELYRRLSIRTIRKNDIEHHNVFEGKEAVVCMFSFFDKWIIIDVFI